MRSPRDGSSFLDGRAGRSCDLLPGPGFGDGSRGREAFAVEPECSLCDLLLVRYARGTANLGAVVETAPTPAASFARRSRSASTEEAGDGVRGPRERAASVAAGSQITIGAEGTGTTAGATTGISGVSTTGVTSTFYKNINLREFAY